MKKKWDVYQVIKRCFSGYLTIQRIFAGETFAVSDKKAINNVIFRLFGKEPSYYEDSGNGGDDWRSLSYIAVPHGTEVKLFESKDTWSEQ